MEKLLLTFMSLLLPIASFAAQNNRPEIEGEFSLPETKAVNIHLGYQKEIMLDRKMHMVGGEVFPRYSYDTDSMVLSLNLYETFAIFGTAGVTNTEYTLKSELGDLLNFYSKPGFAWQGGAAYTQNFGERWSATLQGSYENYKTRFQTLDVNGQPAANEHLSKQDFQQWQAGMTVGYLIDFIKPYIGGKYTQATATFKGLPSLFYFDLQSFEFKESVEAISRVNGAMVVGATAAQKNFQFTLESELIGARSILASAELRF